MLAARCDMNLVDHEVDSTVDSSPGALPGAKGEGSSGQVKYSVLSMANTEDSRGEGGPALYRLIAVDEELEHGHGACTCSTSPHLGSFDHRPKLATAHSWSRLNV